MPNFLADVRDFLEEGGPMVAILLTAAFVLWVLIIERVLFIQQRLPGILSGVLATWNARVDHKSWYARQIKRRLLSEVSRSLSVTLPMIKALVALCSLLGLLGTVTGMITVFGVMSTLGTGNARAMASGVSHATIPTMVGMVISISGLYPISYFEKTLRRKLGALNDHMITY